MIDLLLQFGVSNLCLSAGIATVAWLVHRSGRAPAIAHLLWLCVFVKLITPPIWTLPIVPLPGSGEAVATAIVPGPTAEFEIAAADMLAMPATSERIGDSLGLKRVILLVWGVGAVVVLAWSLIRVRRFHRLLGAASHPAPPAVQRTAQEIGERLNIRRLPEVLVTSARLSPMVWWVGGRVRVIVPETLPDVMEPTQLKWVVAHELAHIRRRDHVVRWIEWLACTMFWWNPVAWWARRNLRINEEICCDAMVLRALAPKPRVYADALMTVVEFLATSAVRPPAVASEINSGGALERRFRMIMSRNRMKRTSRWLGAGVVLAAVGLMPFGVAYAQDFDAVGKRLKEAVADGELTAEQARTMMAALKKSSHSGPADETRHAADVRKRIQEIQSAAKAGKIAPEEARAMIEGTIKRADEHGRFVQAHDRHQVEHDRIMAEIEKAVASGRISKAEAAEKIEAVREEIARVAEHQQMAMEEVQRARQAQDHSRAERRQAEAYAEVERARLAVERGELSREEAARVVEKARTQLEAVETAAVDADRARVAAERSRVDREGVRAELELAERAREQADRRRAEAEELKNVAREIERAVESGEMTREQAHEAFERLRRHQVEREHHQRLQAEHRVAREHHAQAADKRAAEIKRLIERGELSREEGLRAIEDTRRAIHQGETDSVPAKRAAFDWESTKKRIETAVRNGNITREEAELIYKAIHERIQRADR